MNKISTFFAENGVGRAEIWERDGKVVIDYIDSNGTVFHTQTFNEGTIQKAESIAEDWARTPLKG